MAIKYHYLEPSLVNPVHPVTIRLVGCGGSGSQMLNNLARIHVALMALGHPGFHVTVMDDDKVTEANIGRQLFSPAEIGMYKCVALASRINRFFGLRWDAVPEKFTGDVDGAGNILITCVDKVAIRKKIGKSIVERSLKGLLGYAETRCYYWMDLGNSDKTGQVILGSNTRIEQPKNRKDTVDKIQNFCQSFPEIKERRDRGPSCSLAEALERQDLFINSMLAQLAGNMLWKLFREVRLDHCGIFLNLETMEINAIAL